MGAQITVSGIQESIYSNWLLQQILIFIFQQTQRCFASEIVKLLTMSRHSCRVVKKVILGWALYCDHRKISWMVASINCIFPTIISKTGPFTASPFWKYRILGFNGSEYPWMRPKSSFFEATRNSDDQGLHTLWGQWTQIWFGEKKYIFPKKP